jgi:DNA-binding transcriptional LysR family regulator
MEFRHLRYFITVAEERSFANNELIVYRGKDFPEYHRWIADILGVRFGGLIAVQECDDSLGVIAAVESGRGLAIVGEFITAVAGNRVRFIPFASEAPPSVSGK